ncbi:flagellin N-terminal helical domain-containing protein [Oryzihumus sp.]
MTSVNTNIAAMNAYRNLSATNSSLSKSLERLSSGFRINRAADDAAGLAISEGLRSQIGGMTQAVRNAQDGTSVVQTAEGALNETTSILQRMRDLSVQASNGGSLNSDATASIQKEIGQLKQELSRIADTTTFNGTKLLDGNYSGAFQVGANAGETISVNIGKAASSVGLGVDGVDVTKAGAYTFNADGTGGAGQAAVTTAASASAPAVMTIGAKTGDDFGSATAATALDSFKNLSGSISFGGKTFDLGSVDYSQATDSASALAALNTAANSALGLTNNAFAVSGTDLTFTVTDAVAGYTGTGGQALNDGTNSTATQLSNATATFTAASGASDAIKAIDAAIKQVSSQRADLGAIQNRFDHTINNLNVAIENTTASESRIRDTDMASEMTKFTQAQVLTQAGTAMLAQANQATQSILKLLG